MIIGTHDTACDQSVEPGKRELAIEARFILSAMEAAGPLPAERRAAPRVRYRVEAMLRLATDGPEDPPRPVYTRDLTPHGLGFISPAALPLGTPAKLHLPAPGGGVETIACNVIRCREMLRGWFDGAVAFKEESPNPLQPANLNGTRSSEGISPKSRYQTCPPVGPDMCV